jgi:hypothetical protein
MLRCTIELLPGGNEAAKRTIGCVEIANVGGTHEIGNYVVVLKKSPPFAGALKAAWKKGTLVAGQDDAEIIAGEVIGHHRQKRGSYDLLYRALKACGLEARNR